MSVAARQAKYPVVCFDLDGTLIQGTVFIWKTLHDHFETDMSRRTQARKDFFGGRISYRRWFEHDLELLSERGVTRDRILAMLKERVRPTQGSHETLETLRRAGVKVAVLSGSLDLVLWAFFPETLFDRVYINRVAFDPDGRLAGGQPTPFDLERKADGLEAIARSFGFESRQCAFVGDNYNDLQAARAAGLSIAFNPRSDELRSAADVVIDEVDLRTILPHLGLSL